MFSSAALSIVVELYFELYWQLCIQSNEEMARDQEHWKDVMEKSVIGMTVYTMYNSLILQEKPTASITIKQMTYPGLCLRLILH